MHTLPTYPNGAPSADVLRARASALHAARQAGEPVAVAELFAEVAGVLATVEVPA